MTETYRVPKHKVQAEMRLLGRNPVRVELYLSEFAESHTGLERPSDLLNGEALYFPVRDHAGQMLLLQRDTIMVASVPFADEYVEGDPRVTALESDEAVSAEVQIWLEDGTSLEGTVVYLLPEGQRRLQDHLNQTERFLILHCDDRVLLVHKHRIVRVCAL